MAKVPYNINDSTRQWVEQHRTDGKIKPSLKVRFATDINYLLNNSKQDKAVMNLALPGQHLPGAVTWNVQEQAGQPVQSATLELINALPISKISTTIAAGSSLPATRYSSVVNQWATDSLGVVQMQGSAPINTYKDQSGIPFREDNVQYRTFSSLKFRVTDASNFPDPSIPPDDDNDVPDSNWPQSVTGIGAYYIMVDTEIIRVCGLTYTGGIWEFTIPPGGRDICGEPTNTPPSHAAGATVTLLGFGPVTGDITALGYLNVDDFRPQRSPLRPGTCLTSYEGYGNFVGPYSHAVDHTSNCVFTGYWFVSAAEPSMDDTGVPRIRIDMKSTGDIVDRQKITADILRRAKTQFGQWNIAQWGDANHKRGIPGDWVDYNSWDPSLMGSYPLAIKIKLAQNKEFLEHMQQTQHGSQCEICRQEHAEWLKTHSGASQDPANFIAEQRSVGKHIYQQSIRVMEEPAGPVKTYIRLMAAIAMAAWDHPAYGTELSQSFTKIPNKLYDNMVNIYTGLIYNGQIDLKGADGDPDWTSPGYDNRALVASRAELTCPFESTYDRAPFWQPMQDLADVNGHNFWITREGYPMMKPKLFHFRPSGQGWKTTFDYKIQDSPGGLLPSNSHEWFMAYGGSIDAYSHSIDSSQIFTQAWVTGTGAFDDDQLTVTAGGTGLVVREGGKLDRIAYSGLGGNTHGLGLTAGVQQVTTVQPDNLILGLDWNTKPAGWGVAQTGPTGLLQLQKRPPVYDGSPAISESNYQKYPVAAQKIQVIIDFFLTRHYIVSAHDPKQLSVYDANGDWEKTHTKEALQSLQTFMGVTADGVFGRATHNAIKAWLDNAGNKEYVEFDIWWYAANDRPWEEYLSAITGVPIKIKDNTSSIKNTQDSVAYAIDDKGTQAEIGKWMKTFGRMLVNMGNRVVDDSINQSIVRTISSNIADPRIIPGDTIWCDVPGFLGGPGFSGTAQRKNNRPPFTNGVYVLSINRSMDLTAGTYTATYSGHRYIGGFSKGLGTAQINAGFDFIGPKGAG